MTLLQSMSIAVVSVAFTLGVVAIGAAVIAVVRECRPADSAPTSPKRLAPTHNPPQQQPTTTLRRQQMGEARIIGLILEEAIRDTNEWLSFLGEFKSRFFITKEYSWRNKRRSFDGARICGDFSFFPTTIHVELKGISV